MPDFTTLLSAFVTLLVFAFRREEEIDPTFKLGLVQTPAVFLNTP